MEALGEAYAPAIALDGWNYIRYLGPFTSPPPEPVFMRVDKGELVVAPNREPSKLWSVVRLRAPEDDVNRHACSLKREGTETFIGYRLHPSEGKGEIVLGSQMRLDVFRVTRMKKPSYIRVYNAPECCDPEINDAETQIAGSSDNGNAAETSLGAVTRPEPPAPVEWYLGISADLKVVIKPFPPMSECSAEMASKRPVWEFTSREEAIRQDYPSFAIAAPTRGPSRANNPMSREYYLQPDRFKRYEKEFWPTEQRRTK